MFKFWQTFGCLVNIQLSCIATLCNTWMVASVNLQPFKMKLVGVIFVQRRFYVSSALAYTLRSTFNY